MGWSSDSRGAAAGTEPPGPLCKGGKGRAGLSLELGASSGSLAGDSSACGRTSGYGITLARMCTAARLPRSVVAQRGGCDRKPAGPAPPAKVALPLRRGRIDTRHFSKRIEIAKKAVWLAGMVQGTSALEGQAMSDGAYRAMVEKTNHELLAGSKHRLWS